MNQFYNLKFQNFLQLILVVFWIHYHYKLDVIQNFRNHLLNFFVEFRLSAGIEENICMMCWYFNFEAI